MTVQLLFFGGATSVPIVGEFGPQISCRPVGQGNRLAMMRYCVHMIVPQNWGQPADK